jgi:hypothetical protein
MNPEQTQHLPRQHIDQSATLNVADGAVCVAYQVSPL